MDRSIDEEALPPLLDMFGPLVVESSSDEARAKQERLEKLLGIENIPPEESKDDDLPLAA